MQNFAKVQFGKCISKFQIKSSLEMATVKRAFDVKHPYSNKGNLFEKFENHVVPFK